jgi:hypothetical protein
MKNELGKNLIYQGFQHSLKRFESLILKNARNTVLKRHAARLNSQNVNISTFQASNRVSVWGFFIGLLFDEVKVMQLPITKRVKELVHVLSTIHKLLLHPSHS